MPENPQQHPLTGLRVVDFTHVLAGPACSYYLGLLGAEVIKVESTGRGDAMRHRGGTNTQASRNAMSTAYLTQAAGKKSVALNLDAPGGKEVMGRLLKSADVLVENHRPETLAKLGLDENSVQGVNPHLIHCSMTGYGRGGDRENAPAYDVNIQAVCGLMSMTGTSETGPMRTGAPVMDYAAALAAGFAITSALYQRRQTGKGTFIDVSMLETGFTLMSSAVTDFLATANAPMQSGNAANSRSPGAGSFACKEGILSLGVNEESQFAMLARVIEKESWVSDARFSTRAARVTNASLLETELAEALSTRSAQQWEDVMLASGVPAARLRTLPESLALHQTKARNYIHTDRETGLQTPTLPFRIGHSEAHNPCSGAPELGQHSEEILLKLGFSNVEIKKMLEDGTVAGRHRQITAGGC
jgi:crotonobetainyl-CoA:carnitine CoA-transferase CaiB-like acyl-CoA transferase